MVEGGNGVMANFGCALCLHLYENNDSTCSITGKTITELNCVCNNQKSIIDAVFRYKELLNEMIDHLSVAEQNNSIIKTLLNIGFTEKELINEFNFCEDEVKAIMENDN
jgi:hypothetical protein